MLRVRIIILNYQGAFLLPKCLPSIVEAKRRSSYPVAITLLNNPSERDGIDYARQAYGTEVEIYQASANKVLCSYNEYLPRITEDIAILLNNDIRVEPNFVDPLVKKFEEDKNCFLVAPLTMSFDGTSVDAGPSRGYLRFGLFWTNALYRKDDPVLKIAGPTFSSGFGAFSRKIFLELGGYDERFLPGIFEDVDICYRARLRGYQLYYEPASKVYHMGQESFKSAYGTRQISVLASRNNFLFLWKNFHGTYFWITHLIFVPLRFWVQWMSGNDTLWQGWVLARRFLKNAA